MTEQLQCWDDYPNFELYCRMSFGPSTILPDPNSQLDYPQSLNASSTQAIHHFYWKSIFLFIAVLVGIPVGFFWLLYIPLLIQIKINRGANPVLPWTTIMSMKWVCLSLIDLWSLFPSVNSGCSAVWQDLSRPFGPLGEIHRGRYSATSGIRVAGCANDHARKGSILQFQDRRKIGNVSDKI